MRREGLLTDGREERVMDQHAGDDPQHSEREGEGRPARTDIPGGLPPGPDANPGSSTADDEVAASLLFPDGSDPVVATAVEEAYGPEGPSPQV